jgi:hypothetical protein
MFAKGAIGERKEINKWDRKILYFSSYELLIKKFVASVSGWLCGCATTQCNLARI